MSLTDLLEEYLVFATVTALTAKFILEVIFRLEFAEWYTPLLIGAALGIIWNFVRRKRQMK